MPKVRVISEHSYPEDSQSEWVFTTEGIRVPRVAAELGEQGGHVCTASGHPFYLTDPSRYMFTIEDIARGLSNVCRFGGQLIRYYSVAEHSVLVHDILKAAGAPGVMALAGLYHDAHEAFYGDIPTPLKDMLDPAYSEMTDRFDRVLCAMFDIGYASMKSKSVRTADLLARNIEGSRLAGKGIWPQTDVPPNVTWFEGLVPESAMKLFLSRASLYHTT